MLVRSIREAVGRLPQAAVELYARDLLQSMEKPRTFPFLRQ